MEKTLKSSKNTMFLRFFVCIVVKKKKKTLNTNLMKNRNITEVITVSVTVLYLGTAGPAEELSTSSGEIACFT